MDVLPSIPRRLVGLEIMDLAFLERGVIAMRMLLPVLGQLVARCQRSSLALIRSPYSPCTTPSPEISAQTLPYTSSHTSCIFSWKWPQLVEGGSSVMLFAMFKLEEVWPS